MTDLEKYITECIIKSDGYQSDYNGNITAEYGNLSIDCDYSIKSDGYYEYGYYNGTGAYNEMFYDFRIDDLNVYDEDGNDVSVDIDAIEKELNDR